MSFKIKAALTCVVLTLSLGALSPAQAAKRLTVPDPDWTGGVWQYAPMIIRQNH